ncbi:thioredoxin-like domain-containing protein [Flammeovirga sp. SubArs3]|uniref:peroxiredoxin family protein n=1 Tax=Flammeovirga sp. SubArs3 TaxID=2995316 RepID=UPI00248BE5EF|nr:thioredoxin-like domain-containing protein [Flammeovirga sp. SubArs3]
MNNFFNKALLIASLALTPISVVTAQDKVVFSDSFSSNSNQWLEASNDVADATVKNGVYQITSKGNRSFLALRDVKFNYKEDYTIEAKLTLNESANTNAFNSIKFGYTKDGSYEYGFNGNGSLSVRKLIKGKGSMVIAPTKLSGFNAYNQNKLSIIHQGDSVHFLVNDKIWKSTKALPFFGPKIGFKVGSKNTVTVDDFYIGYGVGDFGTATVTETPVATEETVVKLDIGETAPHFVAQRVNGNDFELDQTQGSFTLVVFWASWNPKSREQVTELNKAYKKFAKDNFKVVAFGVENDKDSWIKAIESDKTEKWIHVSDMKYKKSDIVELYQIEELPKNFLLNTEGKIIAVDLDKEFLINKLNDHFN